MNVGVLVSAKVLRVRMGQASKMYDRMYNTNDDTLPVPEQLLKTAMDVKSAIAEAMDGHDATVPVGDWPQLL